MPLYEYQCDACGARFELIRKFSDPPVEVCAACGAPGLRKLVSSPAFQFKGSGWYATDYAKKSSESAASAKSDEAKADAKSDATKDAGASKDAGADKPAAAAPTAASPASSGKDKKDK
jgi:putative FmdB family regulatory protein